jgi:single-strand DNA-binding protein
MLTCRFILFDNLKLCNMIKLQIIGRLGKDCIVNTVNAKNVINFSVAHSEKFKDSQGNLQERTTWVDCAYWTDRTAIAQYLTKGVQVFVEGTPEVRTFTRQDNSAGASLTVRVRDVQLLGGGRSENSTPNASFAGNTANSGNIPASSEVAEPVDDLPF